MSPRLLGLACMTIFPKRAASEDAMKRNLNFDIQKVVSSPDWYPLYIHVPKRLMTFVPMTRDCYRNSSFLDRERTLRGGEQVCTVKVDDLLCYYSGVASKQNTLHYILHGAFTCSTLLARYIEQCPASFVLKEPGLLTQLTFLRLQQDANQLEAQNGDWSQLFSLGLRLLARTYSADEIVVIKANDVCNTLAQLLLAHDAQSKMLFLIVPLKTFLISVLNCTERREWMRVRLRGLAGSFSRFKILSGVETTALKDAEAAAFLWLLNAMFCNELCETFPATRVLAMDGEEVADMPDQALSDVVSFFSIPVNEAQLGKILDHPSRFTHAKTLSPYNAQLRGLHLRGGEQKWKEEIVQGIAWFNNFTRTANLDLGCVPCWPE